MEIRLSREKIRSFVGDVLPLWLEGDDLRYADIRWRTVGDGVLMREFWGIPDGFNDGVILTLTKSGEYTVIAEYNGAFTNQLSVPNSVKLL